MTPADHAEIAELVSAEVEHAVAPLVAGIAALRLVLADLPGQASEVYDRQQAAKFLGVSVTTIDRWRRNGAIVSCAPPGAHPRYTRAALTAAKAGRQ